MAPGVLAPLQSVEIHIFSWTQCTMNHPVIHVRCPRPSCVSVFTRTQLNNKQAPKTSWEPSGTAGGCFYKGSRSSWVKPHLGVLGAPLRVLTMKWLLSLEYANARKPFKRWVRRTWRCRCWIYCTEGWRWPILLARGFASLANQQKFVTLFPGCKPHQILMVGRVGIYIILFRTIWTPQDKILNMTETKTVTIVLTFTAVPGTTNALPSE